MAFTPERLLHSLTQLKPSLVKHGSDKRCLVAFSGGLDSSVLLHALMSLCQVKHLACHIEAVHIHHGLHQEADHWADHCQGVCDHFGIKMHLLKVNANAEKGESPEAAARQARYSALASLIDNGDLLLLAHHQDDQAETLLLQLLRGSGPRGQAGMPAMTSFAGGDILRPLLDTKRSDLADYAHAHDLRWIEDQSNDDTRFDRNFLRHRIMPLLKERWPAASKTLSRAASHQAEASQLLGVLAESDCAMVQGSNADVLSVNALLGLDNARQRNVLRYWLHDQGFSQPASVHLDNICTEVLQATNDSMPCVHWPGTEVRRYRDDLFAMRPLQEHDTQACYRWNMKQSLTLPDLAGKLCSRPVSGQGLKAALCQSMPVTVRFRQGGESCQPVGRDHHHELKKLFQEVGLAPWERSRVPLIYLGDQLAAAVGLCLCQPFQALDSEPGLEVEWHQSRNQM